ncbi:transglutaminase domain-containing protein [Mycetocola reblochoni]|uniref:Transglutaminase domain-containing protein n=2 Tax=Mycetocola reblochoni TaxID=331618 RepID=A0A3L6ZN90_9MICO|nr:transglutaminase domain-containing protein [Mycetocola reblochoni]SJN17623.1 Transglutaminase-like enzymes, putative cysteine proteases [Mycetocola reblochoni REB411]
MRGVDVAVPVLLTLVASLGFVPVFGAAALAPALAGIGLGTAVALLASWRRWGVPLTLTAAAAGALLIGPAVVVPEQTLGGVFPSADALRTVLVGSVSSWRDVFTVQPPIVDPATVRVLPLVCTVVAALAGVGLAVSLSPWGPRRVPRLLLVLAPGLALYVFTACIGTAEPFLPVPRAIAVVALSVLWLSWSVHLPPADAARPRPARGGSGRPASRGAPRLRRDGSPRSGSRVLRMAGSLAAAAVVGAGAVLLLPDGSRTVLRDQVVPPVQAREVPSPLAGFRAFTKDRADQELFRVRGGEPGGRIRLAAMTDFDGRVWALADPGGARDVSGAFTVVGRRLPVVDPGPEGGETTTTISLVDYEGIWLPLPGRARTIDDHDASSGRSFPLLRYSAADMSAVVVGGVPPGAEYAVGAADAPAVSDAQLDGVPVADIALPEPRNVPESVRETATRLAAGEEGAIARLRAIEHRLATTGYLSHGLPDDSAPSRAGHGSDRVDELLSRSQMIGDEEQYASAFALMARTLGYPARVVMGFLPDASAEDGDGDGNGDASTPVTGADVTAWVEVPFEGVGWVSFDPTPDDTEIPQDQKPEPQAEPQPQIRQPPRADAPVDELLGSAQLDDRDEERDRRDDDWLVWLRAAGLVLALPAALAAVAAALAAVRAGRSWRRRRTGRPDRVAAAAWDELIDRGVELGWPVPEGGSREHRAARLNAVLAAQPPGHRSGPPSARSGHAPVGSGPRPIGRGHAAADASGHVDHASGHRGGEPDAASTRRQHRESAAARMREEEDAQLLGLARDVDRAVFSGAEPDGDEVARLWAVAAEQEHRMARGLNWHRRLRSLFRLARRRRTAE